MADVRVASFEEIKDLPSHPEKLLIDVRGPNELEEKGKIPFSINIPLAQLEQELSLSEADFQAKYSRSKPKFEDELIFHCSKGGRAQKGYDAAAALGFTNVKNYKGGWNEWSEKESL